MKGREEGLLLLTSHLGDPARKVMTVPQLRKLAQRIKTAERPADDRELTAGDLVRLGYSRQEAERIITLLSGSEQLSWYVQRGAVADCTPITRVSDGYPVQLRDRLGLDSPGSLWAKGDISLLQRPLVALVGSRDLGKDNLVFAREAGRQAALQGFTLVSGNARGADRAGQDACLEHGGTVISIVADRLDAQPKDARVLYLSEDGFDLPFSSQRALSRNRVIHCLGRIVLVAQCSFCRGGTWDGTVKNLHRGWSAVYCFHDGSEAAAQLHQMGALRIGTDGLRDLAALQPERNLFDQ